MKSAVVDIHVTRVMDINTLWLMTNDTFLNALDKVKAIQRIKTIIWKIKEFDT
ncbi:hypothetical protein KR100_01350 [Synechococcus sp. KORDI-100]|nr:hypothetical protein KR100_01350 [Synechococcus sp. KORDI-100]